MREVGFGGSLAVRSVTCRDERSDRWHDQPVLTTPLVRQVALALATAAILGACGGEAPSAERFCGEIEVNLKALTEPDLAYTDDISPLLDLYREIGKLAPLSIEAEWNQLIVTYETASTVVPADPESVQRVVTEAFRAERSAAAVETWITTNCALSMGPISTIVPQG